MRELLRCEILEAAIELVKLRNGKLTQQRTSLGRRFQLVKSFAIHQ
jgi:hypothetical protein